MSGHEDDVHLYEESGIEEGNRRVPLWLTLSILSLLLFFVWYIWTYAFGVQPSAAQFK